MLALEIRILKHDLRQYQKQHNFTIIFQFWNYGLREKQFKKNNLSSFDFSQYFFPYISFI